LILEMVGSHFAESLGQLHIVYALITTAEECCEMVGIVVFINALFNYLNQWANPFALQIEILSPSSKQDLKHDRANLF